MGHMAKSIPEKVAYWIDIAEYDLETAKAMLQAQRFLYVGFMCHQTVEKALKGFYVSAKQTNPPYTHNLSYLASESGLCLNMTEDQKALIDMLEPLNVEARYPRLKDGLIKALDSKRCSTIIERTEAILAWIKRRLSDE
jgi:HEPN domain-containing protein